jgi:hypothetical protein
MFTLSFYRNNSTDKTVVSTNLYSIGHGPGITTISVNPLGSDKPGMDFRLCRFEDCSHCSYFGSVYVTNADGKTIDHFEAPKERPPAVASGEVKAAA